MPNLMAALPNIGCAPSSTPHRKVWLTPTTRVLCSNAANTRNPLKFAGVPQTRQQISVASGPKFSIMWGHVGEMWWCPDGKFLGPAFPASRVRHISDLHPKFALRPHHVWKYGRHPICDRWDQATKEKEERKKTEETTGQKYYNVCICYAGWP